MKKYQIFISYRRDGGDALAGRIADRLTALGYSVFLDVESMRSGKFNEQLYAAIEVCNDFLVVLPPHALDRCSNPEDWVRLEIAHALKCNKNIIPIMARGFEFPESLPEDIDPIRHMEGVTASSEFFDAVIDRIESFLRSRRRRKTHPTVPKREPKAAKEPEKSRVTEEIPLPPFRKVRESDLLNQVQSFLNIINRAHEDFENETALCRTCPDPGDYVESRFNRDLEASLAEASKRYGWREVSEKVHREFFERDYDRAFPEEFYSLSQTFDEGAAWILQKSRFRDIHDPSLLAERTRHSLSLLHTIQNYISYLYDSAPTYYGTRVAEFAILPFLINYRKPLFSWMSDGLEYGLMMDMLFKPYRALFEHLFQGMDLERLTRCVMQQGLCQSIHFPCRVSFSIQTIVETAPDSAVQNEEIRRFLTALRSLYQFLEWQNPQAPKRFRRHLLVNYKYLLQKKVKLTRETVAMLRDMLSACEK